MTPESIFKDMQERIAEKPEMVEEVGGIFQFEITGDDGGSWLVDLKNAPGSVRSGGSDEADCVITVAADDFIGITSGSLDPMSAFMTGKIKVAGNIMLATKLGSLVR